MKEREELIQELWSRCAGVEGVQYTARNPKAPPSNDDLPCITIYELDDQVVEVKSRGGKPIYIRELSLVVEPFIVATKEGTSSKELGTFVQKVKKAIYGTQPNLGGKCKEITEVESSRIHRPPIGENAAGIGLAFKILYVEDINNL